MNASAFTSPFVHSTSSPHVPGILAYFATYRQSLSLRQHRLGYEKFYLHTVFAVGRAVFQGDFVWRPVSFLSVAPSMLSSKDTPSVVSETTSNPDMKTWRAEMTDDGCATACP